MAGALAAVVAPGRQAALSGQPGARLGQGIHAARRPAASMAACGLGAAAGRKGGTTLSHPVERTGKRGLWFVAVLVAAAGLAVAPGWAHTLYVFATDYAPRYGMTKFYFGWGHHLPVDDALPAEMLKACQLVRPDGSVKAIPAPDHFLIPVKLSQDGTYVLGAALKGDFYTMYEEGGRVHHKLAPKTGLRNVVMSVYFEQYAKAIINVGQPGDTFAKPLGHRLEIIPLVNPAKLRAGDYLPIKVLFDGRPAPAFPKVSATYIGFATDDAFAYTTIAMGGRAVIKILHDGIWVVRVGITLPPGDLADKCNELHYTATLTFEAGGRLGGTGGGER